MKKNTVTIAVAIIGLVASSALAFKYVGARVKIKELEAVSRLQNLTIIAIGNKDYVLACKSQTEAEQYLGKVHSKAEDLLGMIHKSPHTKCDLQSIINLLLQHLYRSYRWHITIVME